MRGKYLKCGIYQSKYDRLSEIIRCKLLHGMPNVRKHFKCLFKTLKEACDKVVTDKTSFFF